MYRVAALHPGSDLWPGPLVCYAGGGAGVGVCQGAAGLAREAVQVAGDEPGSPA